MLRLEKVSYTTDAPRFKSIFEDISIEFPCNRNTMIFGDNGSGKTTLTKLLMKFVPPSGGTVEGGTDIAVGVFEDFDNQLFFSTVFEEFNSIANIKDMEYDKAISVLSLKEILKRNTLELSYSQKARLVFALAYLSSREFLIIDCPPNDEKIDIMICEIIKKKSRTIIILLPERDSRKINGKWDRYLIKDKKLLKINGN